MQILNQKPPNVKKGRARRRTGGGPAAGAKPPLTSPWST